MPLFVPPADTPQAVRHVLDLLEREIAGWFENLNTREQNQFWEELRGYAQGRREHPDSRVPLIGAGPVEESVRRDLELLDASVARHLRNLDDLEQVRLWKLIEDLSRAQAEQTRQAAGGFRRHSSS